MPRRRSAIHAGLVGERALIGTPYLADAELRRQYERDIAPRTRAALGKVLPQVFPAGAAGPRRALDLGAGTGAAGAALRAALGEELDVVAVDRVAAPGVVLADLAAGLPPVSGRFDLIVAAHLLGELYVNRPWEQRVAARADRVRAWAATLLEPGGTIVIIEPALRETSRELLGVRDRLLPALDGGRAVFLGIESLIRRKVDPRIEAMVHTAGFVLLLGVLVVVSFKDIFGKG